MEKMQSADGASPALKELFDRPRLRHIAEEAKAVHPDFDVRRFLDLAGRDLDQLGVMQRMRQTARSLGAVLPEDFPESTVIIERLAPRIGNAFVAMTLAEYVALFGQEHFERSMEVLKTLTVFGSAEFAIRTFLRRDFDRTITVMEGWAGHENEHVRRLASEGSRPRLPWSFKLDPMIADPSRGAAILDALKNDPSPYVRKSVANHLNDIAKDHPAWALDRIASWPLEDPRTAWIARHALRTLIKRGDEAALAIVGATGRPRQCIAGFTVDPPAVRLGGTIRLSCTLTTTSPEPQRLVIDYAIHYVKKSGKTFRKVFKMKEILLAPQGTERISRVQTLRDFTTRTHHPGRHEVELLVNGTCLARSFFDLSL
ncbi:DNA alkylation repair protein [Azospirillum sp. SYSU D00513]|uniref:DNA alkylation repair protein n=1 Tax=Azospirillum sp. SYSU D00513 TaxID=2812561 RepID=UPI001A97C536|nr:DNA alkylation repair protein [Azospirillum sp. SYSU D00513]